MSDQVASTYFGLVGEVAGRLEEALSGGARAVKAETRAQRVGLGFRLGLLSRASGIGAMADKPPAHAAMYDCLRSMCEAAGHLSWMVSEAGAVEERSGCIELGQVRAEVDNRKKLLAVHGASWIDVGTKQQQQDALRKAEEMCVAARDAHVTPCRHCSGSGRDQGDVAQWLRARAARADATRDDLNLYALWVGSSADTHQLVPQRHTRDDGNRLELPQSEVGRVVYWAVDLLLTCFPLIASIVRAESLPDIAAVAAWWENLTRTSATGQPSAAEDVVDSNSSGRV